MICELCKRAGEHSRDGKPVQAALFHAHCTDPETCPCQHRPGPYIAPVSQPQAATDLSGAE